MSADVEKTYIVIMGCPLAYPYLIRMHPHLDLIRMHLNLETPLAHRLYYSRSLLGNQQR
jgi:hypothetical protein